MIRISLDTKLLNDKVDTARRYARLTTIQAVEDAYYAAVEATPETTGFLRASWYIKADGVPSRHPNSPDRDAKRMVADLRPFRRLPLAGPRRNVFVADEDVPYEEAGPYWFFTDIYNSPGAIMTASTRRMEVLRHPMATRFTIVNSAFYAEYADTWSGTEAENFGERARSAARIASQATVRKIVPRDLAGRFSRGGRA